MKTTVCGDVSIAFYTYETKFSVKIQIKEKKMIIMMIVTTSAMIISAMIIAMNLMKTMINIIIKPLTIILVIVNSDNGSKRKWY